MKKNILIIGCGNMGLSHVASFIKKNYNIYVYDIDYKKVKKKINITFPSIKNITILKTFPNRKKFLLTIIATKSKERLAVLKLFIKKNISKYYLLEKFPFLTINNFYYFKNNIGFKNFYVNSWAYFLIKKLKIKKINNSQIHIKVGRQGLLSNLLHFIHFFSYLDNYSKIIDKKKSIKIIKFSRDKTYNEVTGKIKIETLNKNKLLVETFTSKKYAFCIKIKNNNKIIYEINFEKNGLIHLKTRTRKETITFPFSSNTTFLFLKALLTGKNQFMPSARIDFKISTFILSFLKVKIY